MTAPETITHYLARRAAEVNEWLDRLVPSETTPPEPQLVRHESSLLRNKLKTLLLDARRRNSDVVALFVRAIW